MSREKRAVSAVRAGVGVKEGGKEAHGQRPPPAGGLTRHRPSRGVGQTEGEGLPERRSIRKVKGVEAWKVTSSADLTAAHSGNTVSPWLTHNRHSNTC